MGLITETFKLSRSKTAKDQPIAFIDPNAPENSKTFQYKDILKQYGAYWSQSPKYKYNFPTHSKGFWFWFLGATEDKWRTVFDKRIKPALEKIHSMEDMPEVESKESLIASLDAIIEKIATAQPSYDTETVLTKEDKAKITDKLEQFKITITNIKDDAEFKETMKKILAFKNAQGHEFSFMNTILILIQNPNAKLVKSKSNWFNIYNRTINDGASPMWIRKPSRAGKRQYSKNEKDRITQTFLKKSGVSSVSELGAGQRERLGVALSGEVVKRLFELYPVFDIESTTLIEGKPDPAQDVMAKQDIPWFTGDEKDENVRPIYSALVDFAGSKGINVELVDADALGGARGVSSSGKIQIINNEGNDVGLTKTLAHELCHELLHQRYVKTKDKELEQYFLGTAQGRDLVEQQAELTAWMVLAAFGFDLKTTSLNYVALWGANEENMIDVFNMVSSVANYMIGEIMKRGNQIKEENVDVPMGQKQYTPLDVAHMLGVQNQFQQVVQQEKQKDVMLEGFNRLLNK